jgi:nicotinate dehydrogenase subunit B
MEDALMRRIAIVMVSAALLGLLGFFPLAWRPAISPITLTTPASFPPESIAKGEILAADGHCMSCHTRLGEPSIAGGYGVKTPFGIIYGSNITQFA